MTQLFQREIHHSQSVIGSGISNVTILHSAFIECHLLHQNEKGAAILNEISTFFQIRSSIFMNTSTPMNQLYGSAIFRASGECLINETCFSRCVSYDNGGALWLSYTTETSSQYLNSYSLCGIGKAIEEGTIYIDSDSHHFSNVNCTQNYARNDDAAGMLRTKQNSTVIYCQYVKHQSKTGCLGFSPSMGSNSHDNYTIKKCNFVDNTPRLFYSSSSPGTNTLYFDDCRFIQSTDCTSSPNIRFVFTSCLFDSIPYFAAPFESTLCQVTKRIILVRPSERQNWNENCEYPTKHKWRPSQKRLLMLVPSASFL